MVVVLSNGRSGTNLILEIISGSSFLIPSSYPEDKQLFLRDTLYIHNYLTKCDTNYIPNFNVVCRFFINNPDSKIIWTTRHPFDQAASKIFRGWKRADDASFKGNIKDMFWAAFIYCELYKNFPGNILTIKVEDVITNIKLETDKMCKFLGLPFEDIMLKPWERIRHEGQKERYPRGLDTSQIDLYKNWETIYNGFFTNVCDFSINDLFEKLSSLLKVYNYKDER